MKIQLVVQWYLTYINLHYRKNDEIEKRLNFLENQRLIDLENLKNETENIRNRIDEIIKSDTKKQEEIKSMEKRIVVNEQNQKDEN